MSVPSCCRGLNAADLRRVWSTLLWSTSSHEAGGGSGLRLTASIGRLVQAQPDGSRQAQWHGSKETARIPDTGRLRTRSTTLSSGNLALPEGTGHTPPTIVIEGVEELVEALLAA
jgi:hypothetical protein